MLAAPDAKTRTTKFAGQGTGTVVVCENRDQAVFIASGLTTPPKGKVYQLWFDDDGTMRSAGLMNAGREATAVLMTGKVGQATGMGVTVEPAGGSVKPTSSPVALMPLPA